MHHPSALLTKNKTKNANNDTWIFYVSNDNDGGDENDDTTACLSCWLVLVV